MAVYAGTDRPVQFGRARSSQCRRGPVIYSSGPRAEMAWKTLASQKGFQGPQVWPRCRIRPWIGVTAPPPSGGAGPVSVSGSALGARRSPREREIKDARAPRCPEPARVAFPAVVLSGRHGTAGLPAACCDGFAGCDIRPLSPIMAPARMTPGWGRR